MPLCESIRTFYEEIVACSSTSFGRLVCECMTLCNLMQDFLLLDVFNQDFNRTFTVS